MAACTSSSLNCAPDGARTCRTKVATLSALTGVAAERSTAARVCGTLVVGDGRAGKDRRMREDDSTIQVIEQRWMEYAAVLAMEAPPMAVVAQLQALCAVWKAEDAEAALTRWQYYARLEPWVTANDTWAVIAKAQDQHAAVQAAQDRYDAWRRSGARTTACKVSPADDLPYVPPDGMIRYQRISSDAVDTQVVARLRAAGVVVIDVHTGRELGRHCDAADQPVRRGGAQGSRRGALRRRRS